MTRRALWYGIGLRARPPLAVLLVPPVAATPLDHEMMSLALSQASRAAEQGEVPVGAVVYHTARGELLSQDHNRREANSDPSAHAEMLAIRAACARRRDWRLNDCTLVVTLEPCAMCAGAIVNARVGRVVFAAHDPKAGAAGSLYRLTEDPRLNHRVTPIAGVQRDAAAALLRDFFRSIRSRPASPPTATPTTTSGEPKPPRSARRTRAKRAP